MRAAIIVVSILMIMVGIDEMITVGFKKHTGVEHYFIRPYLLLFFGLLLFSSGCGTIDAGCSVSAGLRNEIRCGVDLDIPPTPGPS